MTEALAFDALVQALHPQVAALPDDRTGKHTQDTITDAALGALAVFLTPSPAWLASQRTMPPANGRRNTESRFGMAAVPCDQPIRRLLDPVVPAQVWPGFEEVYAALEGAGHVSALRSCAGPLLIAWAGTEDVSAPELHGAHCSQRPHAKGRVPYGPQASTPVLVAPGHPEVIPLAPACITPHAGHATQECDQVAAKRWMARQAGRSPQVTI